MEETKIVINYGNRYGFIGPNGSGKSTIMKAIAARAIPIPDGIDIYFLDGEYPATDKTAISAVFEVQDEVNELEEEAETLNNAMGSVGDDEEQMNAIQQQLEIRYRNDGSEGLTDFVCVVMISHDMRPISQCAQEIYICDKKKITKYRGDIFKFKLHTKKETSKNMTQHMNGWIAFLA